MDKVAGAVQQQTEFMKHIQIENSTTLIFVDGVGMAC